MILNRKAYLPLKEVSMDIRRVMWWLSAKVKITSLNSHFC